MQRSPSLSVCLLFCCLVPYARGQSLIKKELRIPLKSAGAKGLAAVMVWPNEPGPHPLVVLTHGTPRRNSVPLSQMSPSDWLPQAREFARRGWTGVVVMRRGYGDSGGAFQGMCTCSSPCYKDAGLQSAADLRGAIEYLSQLPEVDPSRILSVGRSAGGFANVALSADPPPGLVAAISFAGGNGSSAPDEVCHPESLVKAFRNFGRKSRIPMLWVYAENDHYFGPQLAQQFYHAFTAGGGKVSFVAAPAFGADGHTLFSREGILFWTPIVDEFLRTQNLTLRTTLLPLP